MKKIINWKLFFVLWSASIFANMASIPYILEMGFLKDISIPISLGMLSPPGEYGADIAVAEGQVLGNQQNYGGPFVGLFSTSQELVRKIPGRIAGSTVDVQFFPSVFASRFW